MKSAGCVEKGIIGDADLRLRCETTVSSCGGAYDSCSGNFRMRHLVEVKRHKGWEILRGYVINLI